jgi:hypothetical protein
MAKNYSNGWPSFRALLLIGFAGILLAQPIVRKRDRDDQATGAAIGETVATYMVERAHTADKQAKAMMWMTAISCAAAVAAAGAAVVALVS